MGLLDQLNYKRLLPWFLGFLVLLLVGAGVWSYFSLRNGKGGDGKVEGSVDVEFLWEMTKEFSAEYWYLYVILFVMVLINAPLSTIGIANASTYFSSFMEKDKRVTAETEKRGEHLKGWYLFLIVIMVSMALFVGRNYIREMMFPKALSLITASMYDRYLENHEAAAESSMDENLGDVLFSMRQVSDNASWIIVYWWTDVLTIVVMLVVLSIYLLRIHRTLGIASLIFSAVVIVSGIVYNIQLVRKVNAYLDSEREVMRRGEQYIVNAGMISAFGLRDNLASEMEDMSENLSTIRHDFTSAEHAFYSTWRVVIVLFFAFIFYKTLYDKKITATIMTRLIFVLLLFMTFLTDMSTEMIDKAWRFASVANDNSARFFKRAEATKAEDAKRAGAAAWRKNAPFSSLKVDGVSFSYGPPKEEGEREAQSEGEAEGESKAKPKQQQQGEAEGEAQPEPKQQQQPPKPVLRDVTLEAHGGDVVVIKGKSGSGKSTFLKILAALEMPTTGVVSLDGVDMSKVQKRVWRKRVLYVSQKWGLFHGTILDNILLGSGASGISPRDMQALINTYRLDEVIPDVKAKVGRSASTGGGSMSGGMGKLIVLLRSLVRTMPEDKFRQHFGRKPRRSMSLPCVVLFDEPLAALDKVTTLRVKKMLIDHVHNPRMATFFIMHSDAMDDAATNVLDWTPPPPPLEQVQQEEEQEQEEEPEQQETYDAELLRAMF